MTKKQSNINVDPRNARSAEYKATMEEIVADQVCPLCPPMKWHPNPILKEDDNWLITKNAYPYPNSMHHLLLISKRHIENISDLSTNDLNSVLTLVQWACHEFKIVGGGLTMRFGDTIHTGATIKHLHLHLIDPVIEDGKATPVYFPIG
jgi:ATP adenylyltransferase